MHISFEDKRRLAASAGGFMEGPGQSEYERECQRNPYEQKTLGSEFAELLSIETQNIQDYGQESKPKD